MDDGPDEADNQIRRHAQTDGLRLSIISRFRTADKFRAGHVCRIEDYIRAFFQEHTDPDRPAHAGDAARKWFTRRLSLETALHWFYEHDNQHILNPSL